MQPHTRRLLSLCQLCHGTVNLCTSVLRLTAVCFDELLAISLDIVAVYSSGGKREQVGKGDKVNSVWYDSLPHSPCSCDDSAACVASLAALGAARVLLLVL